MTISLNPELERFVREQVAAGQFASADEVINSAVAALRGRVALPTDELAELRALIGIGVAEADRGELQDWDAEDLRAEGKRLLASAANKKVP